MFKKVIYTLVALLGFTLYAQAQSVTPVIIAGKIVDENGTTIKAKVRLIDVATNAIVDEINETNPSQKYHFELKGNYPKGKYLVYASAAGYTFYSTYVVLGGAEKSPKILNMQLKKAK